MTADERKRLRALHEGITSPWRSARVIAESEDEPRVIVVCPHEDDEADVVAEIDMAYGEECDTAHAALIVGAVNAVRPLCDALDAADARIAALEAALRDVCDAHRSRIDPDDVWCKRCGAHWTGEEHGHRCPVGRALAVLGGAR